MRFVRILRLATAVVLTAGAPTVAIAQQPDATTRQGVIEQAEADKNKALHPYVPSKGELFVDKLETLLYNGTTRWHPFFENAYSGGGFALGLGYMQHIGGYDFVDVRGSYSIAGYKRAEMEFVAPRLFNRRGELSSLAGWREATQVGFFGLGTNTSKGDRTNYDFQQPRASAHLKLWPARRLLLLAGGAEISEWSIHKGQGTFPSVETRYTPATLPGLGARTTYLHTQGTVGLDWRTSSGYTRRGGFYGVTVHDFKDQDDEFGFEQVDYEIIQHLPILRETWVLSLHGLARTTANKNGQQIPFFMMPALGGGSSLRGYSSWRFRDENSLLVQAEWRIMANRFLDSAIFYDAGKVTTHKADLDLNGLKSDYGFGVRFHTPFATPLRIEVARSREGTALIFSSSAVF